MNELDLQFKNIFTKEHVRLAYEACSKGTSWKPSVAKYRNKTTIGSLDLQNQIILGLFQPSLIFNEFDIDERGKKRHISAPKYLDKVFQKCLCDNYLIDVLKRPLIQNNFACLKGKGVKYARDRFARDLIHCLNSTDKKQIYILSIDFRKYFYNINHNILKKNLNKYIKDPDVKYYLFKIIDTFGDRGLGLGSQVSQILSVFHTNTFDHYLTNYKHYKYFGRYMDDSYVMSDNLQELKDLINEIRYFCERFLDIELSEEKIKITKIYVRSNFRSSVTFIKCKYSVLNNKIIWTENSDKNFYKREASRLKCFKRKLLIQEMDISEIENLYKCWRFSTLKSFTNPTKVFFMDIRYVNLFGADSFLKATKSDKHYENDFIQNKKIFKMLLHNFVILNLIKSSPEFIKVSQYIKHKHNIRR